MSLIPPIKSYIKCADFDLEKLFQFARNGFSRPFGTYTERACSICVVIVRCDRPGLCVKQGYDIYLTHGTPGGAFWRSAGGPIRRCDTELEARQWAETLYGIAGSGELATLVDW